jgi:hypothetical protein
VCARCVKVSVAVVHAGGVRVSVVGLCKCERAVVRACVRVVCGCRWLDCLFVYVVGARSVLLELCV